MALPSDNRRALRSHPCVALSSRYPGKAITGYTIFHDWTIVENSIVLDMGSTLNINEKKENPLEKLVPQAFIHALSG